MLGPKWEIRVDDTGLISCYDNRVFTAKQSREEKHLKASMYDTGPTLSIKLQFVSNTDKKAYLINHQCLANLPIALVEGTYKQIIADIDNSDREIILVADSVDYAPSILSSLNHDMVALEHEAIDLNSGVTSDPLPKANLRELRLVTEEDPTPVIDSQSLMAFERKLNKVFPGASITLRMATNSLGAPAITFDLSHSPTIYAEFQARLSYKAGIDCINKEVTTMSATGHELRYLDQRITVALSEGQSLVKAIKSLLKRSNLLTMLNSKHLEFSKPKGYLSKSTKVEQALTSTLITALIASNQPGCTLADFANTIYDWEVTNKTVIEKSEPLKTLLKEIYPAINFPANIQRNSLIEALEAERARLSGRGGYEEANAARIEFLEKLSAALIRAPGACSLLGLYQICLNHQAAGQAALAMHRSNDPSKKGKVTSLQRLLTAQMDLLLASMSAKMQAKALLLEAKPIIAASQTIELKGTGTAIEREDDDSSDDDMETLAELNDKEVGTVAVSTTVERLVPPPLLTSRRSHLQDELPVSGSMAAVNSTHNRPPPPLGKPPAPPVRDLTTELNDESKKVI